MNTHKKSRKEEGEAINFEKFEIQMSNKESVRRKSKLLFVEKYIVCVFDRDTNERNKR